MDFVEWCGVVLNKIIEMSRSMPEVARRGNVSDLMLALELFGDGITNAPGYWESTYRRGTLNAMKELSMIGFFEEVRSGSLTTIRTTHYGRASATDIIPFWEAICRVPLDTHQETLLHIVNGLSAQCESNHAWLKQIGRDDILPHWTSSNDLLVLAANELHQIGFIRLSTTVGHQFHANAKYQGLVWETRRGLTLESKWIDAMVEEWETTSVDFKRELYLDTASNKAEFIKDVIGLANTQASGRRWMIIGFDDKSRQYYGPPSSDITQNRIEQIVSQYVTPSIEVKYTLADYRLGRIGKLEIIRDPRNLPYCVAKPLGDKAAGDKKRIESGQYFVRHGSQTEQPTPSELLAIENERNFHQALLRTC